MKILVLATDYPAQDNVSAMFIHTRNQYYVEHHIDVTVLNFKAKNNYIIDAVKVITLKDFQENKNREDYDILISHAPNIRKHFFFLRKYEKYFSNIVFFFHGHEILRTSLIYPKPYSYVKNKGIFYKFYRDLYDIIKLKIWSSCFRKILHKSYFIFVSKWMYKMFRKFTKIEFEKIDGRKQIIYNSVGKKFEKNVYDSKSEKNYDFITIRSNLDGSKYAIDIVAKIAKENSKYTFCIIGKGNYFKYNEKPRNLIWLDRTFTHDEIITFLNKSKCALMPTRTDAQGVMACEMATFGIPLITSDIDVYKEVFFDFENVEYIDNQADKINIEPVYRKVIKKTLLNKEESQNKKYFSINTIYKEIEFLNMINRR